MRKMFLLQLNAKVNLEKPVQVVWQESRSAFETVNK